MDSTIQRISEALYHSVVVEIECPPGTPVSAVYQPELQ